MIYEIYARHITWDKWLFLKITKEKKIAKRYIRDYLDLGCDIMVIRSWLPETPLYFIRGTSDVYLDSCL